MFKVKDISTSLRINKGRSNYHCKNSNYRQAECKTKLINDKEEKCVILSQTDKGTLIINVDFKDCKEERLNDKLNVNYDKD